MTLVVGSVDIYLVMAGAQNVQQRNIASLGFHVGHELLLQVVAIDVLLGRLHEPVTDIVPVNAPKLCFRNVNLSCLVILAYVGSIGELNSSVLNFCAGVIKVPRGQFVTLGIGMGPVKSPIAESVDDTQIVHARREPNIALVLVCASDATGNDPMKVRKVIGKLNIYPVFSSVDNLWVQPRETAFVGEIEPSGMVDQVIHHPNL